MFFSVRLMGDNTNTQRGVHSIIMPKYKKVAQKSKKLNPWNKHVAAFRKQHPGMSFKEVLQAAAKTYNEK